MITSGFGCSGAAGVAVLAWPADGLTLLIWRKQRSTLITTSCGGGARSDHGTVHTRGRIPGPTCG
jgi:hypothetical protein